MGLDLNNDYSSAKSKVRAYKTVNENKKNEKLLKNENTQDSTEKGKEDVTRELNELKKERKEGKNKVKSEIKSQLEELLDLYKEVSLPDKSSISKKIRQGSVEATGVDPDQTLNQLNRIFAEAANNTREKLKSIVIDEIITTLGCSEEQTYQDQVNQPIYIKVKHVDLFKRLLFSPEDENAKYYYEDESVPVNTFPYSMNREIYHRTQSQQSFFDEYGTFYKGLSGNDLFDFKYVESYVDPTTNVTVFGEFFEVVLKGQPNDFTSISDFLYDYYGTIEVLNFNILSTEIYNSLFGIFDFGIGLSSDELREQTKFEKILKRMMGICSDPTKSIDVAGTAKLNDLDFIDDSFFEVSNQELRNIEQTVLNIQNGSVVFTDCGDVELPMNIQLVTATLDEIIKENKDSKKIDLLLSSFSNIANDPKWKTLVPRLGLDINLNLAIQGDFLLKLPRAVFKTILSPKVMLGFMIMVKSIRNAFTLQLDLDFDNLNDFLKLFRNFTIKLMVKITSIFVEELFKLIKKNILKLVETILLEVSLEATNKKVRMIATITYILLVLGEAFVDYQNCKSVIDEILKLLNLAIAKVTRGLPQFALNGAQFLGGVSDTRAFANTVENLQKAGLPTGDAPDGGPNLMNMALMGTIKGMNQEQAENGKTEISIPPLTVFVPPLGAGPGTTKPTKGYGKSY